MVSFLDTVKGYLSFLMALLTMVLVHPIAPPELPKYTEDLDLHKKRVLITGATGGIGKELVSFYASHGAEVFLLCRSEERGNQVKAEIQSVAANENLFVEVVDHSSLASINAFLEKWTKRSPAAERRIDVIHNNAGGIHSRKTTTKDGFEMTYQSNFLSAFLLTTSLLNMGAFAPDARIIQTCSTAAFGAISHNPSSLNSEALLNKVPEGGKVTLAYASLIYGRAKALQWAWTSILQEKLTRSEKYKDVVVQCCHPGWVSTGFWTDPRGVAAHPYLQKFCLMVGAAIGITPTQGAVTPIFLATSAEASVPENRGKFWDKFGWRWTPGWMADPQLREGFWKQWQSDACVEVRF